MLSTNLFLYPPVQYFMWTEKLLLTDLRYLDNTIRQIMNENRAKYKLQLNKILYLPRSKGGRGLQCFETTYKEIKIKTAMKLITETEPCMKLVLDFDKKRMEKNRSSILRDAIDFTENDFNAKLEIADHNFIFSYKLLNEWKSTSDHKEAVNIIKQRCVENGVENVINASWQGVNFKTGMNDGDLIVKGCFSWLSKWKECPVNIINDMSSVYLQTVKTLKFLKSRSNTLICSVT